MTKFILFLCHVVLNSREEGELFSAQTTKGVVVINFKHGLFALFLWHFCGFLPERAPQSHFSLVLPLRASCALSFGFGILWRRRKYLKPWKSIFGSFSERAIFLGTRRVNGLQWSDETEGVKWMYWILRWVAREDSEFRKYVTLRYCGSNFGLRWKWLALKS